MRAETTNEPGRASSRNTRKPIRNTVDIDESRPTEDGDKDGSGP